MSEIKNVGLTWMALNNFKCNHLMPLHFKGLKLLSKNLIDCVLMCKDLAWDNTSVFSL